MWKKIRHVKPCKTACASTEVFADVNAEACGAILLAVRLPSLRSRASSISLSSRSSAKPISRVVSHSHFPASVISLIRCRHSRTCYAVSTTSPPLGSSPNPAYLGSAFLHSSPFSRIPFGCAFFSLSLLFLLPVFSSSHDLHSTLLTPLVVLL